MKNQSEKWMKYQILIKYDLATEAEINTQIRRYSKQRLDNMIIDIEEDMQQNKTQSSYIIKLVPIELRPKLRNIIIRDHTQLDSARATLLEAKDYFEIWWCKTASSLDSGVFGRFYINSGGTTEVSQCIEQVWADSARKIERIGDGTPYLFAHRLWWGRRYQIESSNFSSLDSISAKKQFYEISRQLEAHRNGFDRLVQDAIQLNIYSLCMEYKLIDGKVHIIDWDSPSDKTILRGLL